VHIFVEYLWYKKIIPNRVNIDVHIDKQEHQDLVVFTRQEIAKILDVKTKNLMGYRDKAIFELSYSIGIKPTECINLELKDVNTTIGYLKYRKKDGYRTIALNKESVDAIENYIVELKKEYPNAKVLAHPECKEEILNLADYIGSTSGIIEEVLKGGDEFIVVTERGIQHKIYEKAPNKKLYFADTLICKSMKKNTLEKIEKILLEGGDELEVNDEIAKKALIPLERMLKLAGD